MTVTEALKRALATFAQSAIAVLLASGLSGTVADLSVLQRAGLAGLTSVLTFVSRVAQSFLESRKGGGDAEPLVEVNQ